MGIRFDEITAILGGTFDPPHVGHLAVARELLDPIGVSRIVVMPNGNPPLKSQVLSSEHRLAVTKIAFENFGPKLVVSDFEIKRAKGAPEAPTTTYETLLAMQAEYGRGKIAFCLGIDQLNQLDRWKNFPELLSLSHWIVLARGGVPISEAEKAVYGLGSRAGLTLKEQANKVFVASCRGIEAQIALFTTQAPDISSTFIRKEIARSGHPPEGTLTPETLSYLKLNRLYGMSPT